MKAPEDGTWLAYLARYDKVYDPVANAAAADEAAKLNARRKSMNAQRRKRDA